MDYDNFRRLFNIMLKVININDVNLFLFLDVGKVFDS